MRVIAVTIVALALLAGISAAASAAPSLSLSEEVWDFGEIYQWTNPSKTIGISNTGDKTLEISDVKASCGCTATFLSSKAIKPGEKGSLRIDFASYTVTGRIAKMVRLITNDPAAPQKDIAIRGFVKDDKGALGRLDADFVDLGVVAPYETRKVEMLINNIGNIDLGIGDIELPAGWRLDSAMPERAKVRSGAAVHLVYRPAVKQGPITDTIRVRTNGIDGGLLDLKVAGYVADVPVGEDALVLTPTSFSAGGAGGGRLVLSVKNGGGAAVSVEGVDSSLEVTGMELDRTSIAPGEVGTLRLDVDPAGLSPGTRGYVYIRLGLPVEVR